MQKYRKAKKALLALEILFGAVLAAALIVLYVPAVKAAVVKGVASSSIGAKVISYLSRESYDSSVLDTDFDESQVTTNDLTGANITDEYINFVIFGIDARDSSFDEGTRTDSILIVSINTGSGEVKICSVYRDTYLQIQNTDGTTLYSKVNSAYATGGAVSALNTLNTNLDLNLTDYVVVNFSGVEKIIDELGGIEVNLTDAEVAQINKHMKTTIVNTGSAYSPVSSSGENITLNGTQAVTYCRIRKAAFYDPETGEKISDDYGRAARQRLVISQLIEKAQDAGISELINIANLIFESNTEDSQIIGTSFTLDEIIEMIPVVFDFELSGSEGFPAELTTTSIGGASCVVAMDLEDNVAALHEFLFDDEDYTPSSTVSEISSYISGYTGIYSYGEVSYDETDDDDSSDDSSGSDEDSGSDDSDSSAWATSSGTILSSDDYDYDDGGISDLY